MKKLADKVFHKEVEGEVELKRTKTRREAKGNRSKVERGRMRERGR